MRRVYGCALCDRPPLLDLVIALGLFGVGVVEVLGAPIAEDVVEGSTVLNVAAVALTTLPLAAPPPGTVRGRRDDLRRDRGARARRRAARDLPADDRRADRRSTPSAAYAPLRDALVAAGAARARAGDRRRARHRRRRHPAARCPPYILAGGVLAAGRVVVRHTRALAVERAAEERAAVAAAEERARLARELHDAVSHSLASIVMQAGGAQDVLRQRPRPRGALAGVDRAGGASRASARCAAARADRRRLGPARAAADAGAPRQAVGGAREAGLDVDADVEGEVRPLPPAVDLSAYRIVQEALTNAMKHAGRCRARRVPALRRPMRSRSRSPTTARRGRRPDRRGRGLAGMRERVGVLGGDFDAGPRPGGPRLSCQRAAVRCA